MAIEAAAISDRTLDFHLKEYERLRDEIMFLATEMRSMERAAVIGPVVAYSWLAVQAQNLGDATIVTLAWWLPLLLVFVLARRRHHAFSNILRIASYLRRLEEEIARPSLGGWEHQIDKLDTRRRKIKIFVGDRLLWTLLCVVCTIVPLIATQELILKFARSFAQCCLS